MTSTDGLVLDGVLRPSAVMAGATEALLPTTAVQSHAANLMPFADGDLGCVWFGGTQEGMSDISIHFARLRRGADRWSDSVRLIDDPTRSEQNPILFPAPDGRLLLLYTSQRSGNQDTAVIRFRVSQDRGATWSEPATLIDTPGTFVRQPLRVLPDGTWLLPVFHCRTPTGVAWTGSYDTSSVMLSGNGGRTWSAREVPESLGSVHMNVLALGTGGYLALYRSRWADNIYASRSRDGLDWSPPKATALPNNNASIQATVLRDGRIALVYNHSSAANATARRESLYDDLDGEEAQVPAAAMTDRNTSEAGTTTRSAFWGAPRAPLCLVLSQDGGRTWGTPLEIDTSDGYCLTNNSREKLNRELSYPSVVETADGRLHVAYTYFRQAIKHVTMDIPPAA